MHSCSRAPLIAVMGLAIVLWAAAPMGASRPLRDGGARAAAGKTLRLKDRLEKGLKARRPQEFAYVAKVVRLVEKGTLSKSLVDGTFLWARSKQRHPFQYFQHALSTRARRRGIKL